MKPSNLMMLLLLTVSAPYLTACGSGGIKTIDNIPSELLATPDRPEPPTGAFQQGEFGYYAVELDTELKQCNADKESIGDYIDKVRD